jgi:hypothetical protein
VAAKAVSGGRIARQRRGLRQPSAALRRPPSGEKAAEGCRVQNLAESSSRFSGAATVFVKPLWPSIFKLNSEAESGGGNTG